MTEITESQMALDGSERRRGARSVMEQEKEIIDKLIEMEAKLIDLCDYLKVPGGYRGLAHAKSPREEAMAEWSRRCGR